MFPNHLAPALRCVALICSHSLLPSRNFVTDAFKEALQLLDFAIPMTNRNLLISSSRQTLIYLLLTSRVIVMKIVKSMTLVCGRRLLHYKVLVSYCAVPRK